MSERTHQRDPLASRRSKSGDDSLSSGREVRAASPAATYRELRVVGFGTAEAGNLTAYLLGIWPVMGGWRLSEIEHLLFLHDRIRRGRAFGPTAGS